MTTQMNQTQLYEDMYGNEVKRRRINQTQNQVGDHLKVWVVCNVTYGIECKKEIPAGEELIYVVQDEVHHEDEDEDEVHHQDEDEDEVHHQDEDEDEVHHEDEDEDEDQVQEQEVQEQEQEQEQEVQEQEVQEQEVQVHHQEEVQEDPVPVHLIGRTLTIQTISYGSYHGRLAQLFDLNGERAIRIETPFGDNLIFMASQISTLQLHYDVENSNSNSNEGAEGAEGAEVAENEVAENEVAELSPIAIADDETVQEEEHECEKEEDDFPDVEFIRHEGPSGTECCSICFDATDPARNFVSLQCGHQFHFACIMGNMANGGNNRNQCPMCRGVVVSNDNDNYNDNDNDLEEVIRQSMQRNQRLQHELDRTIQHREQLSVEYARVMSMNLEIGTRYDQEEDARAALNRRAYICGLNERIATVVAAAANNDIRQNYENGAAVHTERQIMELCMSFGMLAYDRQYDELRQHQYQYEEDHMD